MSDQDIIWVALAFIVMMVGMIGITMWVVLRKKPSLSADLEMLESIKVNRPKIRPSSASSWMDYRR